MSHGPITVLALFKETGAQWLDDKAPTFAASIAYYTAFSLAPTLVIALAVAGAVFGADAARGAVEQELTGFIGPAAAEAVQGVMASNSTRGSGLFASIVGAILMIFAATAVFAELQTALNVIWKVKPKQTNGVLAFLRTRFLSLGVVLGIGFLLMVSLVISAVIGMIGNRVGLMVPGWATLMQVFNVVLSFAAITVLFAMMFKLLPDEKIAWRDVWLGAAVSSGLFAFGKYLIALYITESAVASSYGAAGSLAALLIWVYYSSLTTLFGAELAQVYAHARGSLKSAPVPRKLGPHGPHSNAGGRPLPGSAA